MSRCSSCDKRFIPEWTKNGWSKYCSDCDWKDSPELTRDELERLMKDYYERQTKNDNQEVYRPNS